MVPAVKPQMSSIKPSSPSAEVQQASTPAAPAPVNITVTTTCVGNDIKELREELSVLRKLLRSQAATISQLSLKIQDTRERLSMEASDDE